MLTCASVSLSPWSLGFRIWNRNRVSKATTWVTWNFAWNWRPRIGSSALKDPSDCQTCLSGWNKGPRPATRSANTREKSWCAKFGRFSSARWTRRRCAQRVPCSAPTAHGQIRKSAWKHCVKVPLTRWNGVRKAQSNIFNVRLQAGEPSRLAFEQMRTLLNWALFVYTRPWRQKDKPNSRSTLTEDPGNAQKVRARARAKGVGRAVAAMVREARSAPLRFASCRVVVVFRRLLMLGCHPCWPPPLRLSPPLTSWPRRGPSYQEASRSGAPFWGAARWPCG